MEYTCLETFNDKWLIESFFRGMRDGFFIEAGGADGIYESTSYVLEKDFNWRGIILEPGNEFYGKLISKRTSKCINAALSDKDGSATFVTANDRYLSGIEQNITEFHKKAVFEEGYVKHLIETISMKTLLMKYQCPEIIDYIHLDIEGSELMVLKEFPFDQYLVKLFIIEMSDQNIRPLMLENGFLEVKNEFNTDCPWENYFVNKKIIHTNRKK